MDAPRLEEIRRATWEALLTSLSDPAHDVGQEARVRANTALADTPLRVASWEAVRAAAERRHKLAQAAFANERLSQLFPFTSVGRLCFSRCSDFPYTNDCPAIASTPGAIELYVVVERPYGPNGSGARELGESSDASDAVEIAAANLPANAEDVWLGSLEDRPPAEEG